MCRIVNCRQCGKTTWTGCGQHVDTVMQGVPRADRCPGNAHRHRISGSGIVAKILGR